MLRWLTGPLLAALLHVDVEVEPVNLCLYRMYTCATCILEREVELVLAKLPIRPVNLHEPLCAFISFGDAEPVTILLTV